MKEYLRRGMISFIVSCFCGMMVNLIIDTIVHSMGNKDFTSISPFFLEHFSSPITAAYLNILLYGVIGFTFSIMTFVFDLEKIGFIIQSIIYFVVTSAVYVAITVLLWQLQKRPEALISTLAGYAGTFVLMCIIMYRSLKKDMEEINSSII